MSRGLCVGCGTHFGQEFKSDFIGLSIMDIGLLRMIPQVQSSGTSLCARCFAASNDPNTNLSFCQGHCSSPDGKIFPIL